MTETETADRDNLSAVELIEELLSRLSPIDSFEARLARAANDGPRASSAGAEDAACEFGGLPGTFAAQNIAAAVEHLRTWQVMVDRAILPTFAQMTLLRGALEGAATARWLLEPGTSSADRVQRAATLQLEDHRNRRTFEESFGLIDREWAEDTKSGADRQTEHLDEMAAAGVAAMALPKFTWLVDKYGPGDWAYQLTSGLAHRRQWATVLFSHRDRVADGPSFTGSSAIKLTIDSRWAIAITRLAVKYTQAALAELETYLGSSAE